MRNRTADMQKNAPITHCMTVHKKRIAIIYFTFILECQFSICAYCPDGGCELFLTVYYQDILGLSDRLIIAAGNQQRSAGKAPTHKKYPQSKLGIRGHEESAPPKPRFFYWRGYMLSSYF